ncbi:MAG: hypothetical protein ACREC6_09565, partial [Hyphomicrobiaceae bacterium]
EDQMSPLQRRGSLLHLQMGQEVIYILLACALLGALFLLGLVVRLRETTDGTTAIVADLRGLLEQSERRNKKLSDNLERIEKELQTALDGGRRAREDRVKAQAEAEGFRKENEELKRPPPTPPIINLTEAQGFRFASGSAELSVLFRDKLIREIVPKLIETGRQYKANVVEVIGHTDEVVLGGTTRDRCNLDSVLLDVLNGRGGAATLVPCDNVGLGMARAAQVAKVLNDGGLKQNLFVLPLSAGQAITTKEFLAAGMDVKVNKEDAGRRRIEIRVRRRNSAF